MNDEALTSMDNEQASPAHPGTEPAQNFSSVAAKLNDNLAAAALRMVDASHDFTSLIQSFVAAGVDLERSLAIHRELGAASQKALEDAREAAREAADSTSEAQAARAAAMELVDKAKHDYGTVAELVDNLQQRIAALSILAAPMPRPAHGEAEADAESDSENVTDLRAAS